IKDIGKAAGIFDPEKLLWMNGEYIRAASIPELVKMAVPFLLEWDFIEDGESLRPHGHTYIESVMKALQERLGTLEEIKERGWYFFQDIDRYDPKGVRKHFLKEGAKERLKEIAASLEQLDEWSAEAVEGCIRRLAESAGEKAGIYIHPLRLAVSGMTGGPSAFEIVEMLGQKRVIARLKKALKYLQELQDDETI
ncbi:MAG: glutamate--tRNA ligase, partial [Armatimonadetes bacterium]|nr:glutamate--tRNA ligase [Armatimonadota bacterium]